MARILAPNGTRGRRDFGQENGITDAEANGLRSTKDHPQTGPGLHRCLQPQQPWFTTGVLGRPGTTVVKVLMGWMRDSGDHSDGHDPDIRVIGSEKLKVSRSVGENESAAKPNRSSYYQGADGHVGVPTCCGQEVAGDSRDPHPGCHHSSEPAAKHVVDRLTGSSAPVELDEDGGGDAHRVVPALGAPQRSPDPLVAPGDRFGGGQARTAPQRRGSGRPKCVVVLDEFVGDVAVLVLNHEKDRRKRLDQAVQDSMTPISGNSPGRPGDDLGVTTPAVGSKPPP